MRWNKTILLLAILPFCWANSCKHDPAAFRVESFYVRGDSLKYPYVAWTVNFKNDLFTEKTECKGVDETYCKSIRKKIKNERIYHYAMYRTGDLNELIFIWDEEKESTVYMNNTKYFCIDRDDNIIELSREKILNKLEFSDTLNVEDLID